jgi:hypothetical protein
VTAAVVVAGLALLFTVASFWWIQMRRGRLEAYEPQTFSGFIQASRYRLRLPLTIYNTGARTLVVTDLRAVFAANNVGVPVITFRRSIKPIGDDVEDFAHPFPVAGRQAVSRFVEFGADEGWAPTTATTYRIAVEARVGGDRKWRKLVDVELTTPDGDLAKAYITHRRDPTDNVPRATVWEVP